MARGGRQTVDYAFRGGQTENPNATSAERAAQRAFSTQRSGGIQVALKSQSIKAAIGDTIVIENTSATTSDRPRVILPKVTADMTGKSIWVTYADNATTVYYRSTGVDGVNAGTAGAVDLRSIAPTVQMHQYVAIGPSYGWRLFALQF